MLAIKLFDRLGDLYAVDDHPTFVDYSCTGQSERSEVDCADDNAIAPSIARLRGGRYAMDTLAELRDLQGRIKREAPHREDGLQLVTLLLSWADRWRNGTWEVNGEHLEQIAARGKHGIDLTSASSRHASTSVTVTGFERGIEVLGNFDRMINEADIMERDPLAAAAVDREASTHELMKGPTIAKGGGGSRSAAGRSKERPLSAVDRNRIRDSKLRDQATDHGLGGRSDFVGARVSPRAKEVLREHVMSGEVLEAVAAAIVSGRTWDQIRSGMSRIE